MSKIQGYQIIDIKISELPATGLAYLTALVEVKGCTFAASVKLDTTKPDPFTEARGRAVTEALRESERSDLALYGRHAPRPAGNGSWGKKGKTPTQCRKCGQDIILLKNDNDQWVRVVPASYSPGDEKYCPEKHKNHDAVCGKQAQTTKPQPQAKKEQATNPPPPERISDKQKEWLIKRFQRTGWAIGEQALFIQNAAGRTSALEDLSRAEAKKVIDSLAEVTAA